MTKGNDTGRTGILRHPITSLRSCSLGVIISSHLEWQDHIARIVDLSITGVGIESSVMIPPGFVWFNESVGGNKYGVLTWCKPHGDQYRAGINFVTLARDEEQYIEEQVKQLKPHTPLRDPRQIISTMIESLKRSRGWPA
ncbi:MAG: PilZ domain-containing protein [Nitrospirota bacterium]